MFIHEDLGFSARIENPRDRLVTMPGRKWDLFYALGEFLWYVSGSNDLSMISHYAPSYTKFSDDGKTLYGAYGTRMFSFSDVDRGIFANETPYESVIRKLKSDPDSRQAILLLWNNEDMNIKKTSDLPCTVYLQFFIRDGKLNLITNMRSNDVWLGATNDIFCFTMLQEMVASELGIELGFYQHNAGSLHVYQNVIEKFSDPSEIQLVPSTPTKPMPKLREEIGDLIEYEQTLRQTLPEMFFSEPSTMLMFSTLSDEALDLAYVLYCGNIRKRMNAMKKDNRQEEEVFGLYQEYFEIGLGNIQQESLRLNLLSR
jgi:thymidylate synthase